MSHLTRLECSLCRRAFRPGLVLNLCECGGPLLVRYDLDKIRAAWKREDLPRRPHTMWRYAPVLPPDATSVVTLGEGMTPLIPTPRLGARLGAERLWVKDEGLNPTGSCQARGLSCAVSMARELGIPKLAIASAGNAASAMAAYAAAAGIPARIFLPRDVPQANFIECMAFGAEVTLVDGLIAGYAAREGWFDLGALKEPYRIEGKKTMGYEVAEQMDWELPDAILYPTGDGVGLIGMWKAFDEMEALGWIGPRRPKMIAVQAEGGLRVPQPLGDFLTLDAVRASHGTAIAVSDAELLDTGLELARLEGIFAAPEGAACVAALRKLLASGFLKPEERIVIHNTGSGLKYIEAYSTRFPRTAAGEQDKLGGLITPR